MHVEAVDPAVDPDRFRAVAGRFATGVTVVTSHHGGRHHAMTANSFVSVSLDPLLVLISVDRRARLHDLVLAAEVWGVSVLRADQEPISRLFASRRSDTDERLDAVAYEVGSRTGVRLIAGALAHLECSTRTTYDGGDHTLLVGSVLSMRVVDADGPPLLYFGGAYRRLR